jgi:hypothetical protein
MKSLFVVDLLPSVVASELEQRLELVGAAIA